MLFNEFGKKEDPPVLLLHGMMQDQHNVYKLLKPLEDYYRLIIPAQDGFYEGSGEFTSFADQARQIEEFVQKNYGGELYGAYGVSQGGLMLTELIGRNKIEIKTVIMDGCYVAHQGRISGFVTYKMFCKYKNTGKFPWLINLTMALMGTALDEMMGCGMKDALYLNSTDETVKRNFMENYTYHASPNVAGWKAKVYLWCGSKEPYAIKSHNILKKYLKNYEEEIMDGLAHGELLMKTPEKCCEKIRETLDK